MRDTSPSATLRDIAGRIAARRNAAGDSFLETMPDDPAGVAGWVVKHQDASRAVLAEDALDCLLLIQGLRKVLDRREMLVMRLARKSGVTWQQIAKVLGATSRQAARQHAAYLEREHGNATEKEIEAILGAAIREEEWLDKYAAEIVDAANAFIAAAPDGAPDLAEELSAHPILRDVMIWMAEAVRTHSPGLCPEAEVLVAERDAVLDAKLQRDRK
jgi:hypothetical protein